MHVPEITETIFPASLTEYTVRELVSLLRVTPSLARDAASQ